jgi:pectin methylesterase-like acyl-CoA thioesterase
MKKINTNPKKKRFQKSMQVASLIVLFMLVALTKTNAITRYVNTTGTWGSNTPCYSTIQAAITASSTGDVINVDAGTYNESLIVPSNVTITGTGTQSVIIQKLNVTQNTTLITVGSNSRIDNITLAAGEFMLSFFLAGFQRNPEIIWKSV